ncbi:trafficking protein particle complex subunit 2-like protein isoform X1 [Balaenoptera acutorostrata]|uniref:Trafficking protein particle complex subunit 2-like protein isoform X1 n=1 Tax=Balaenoptera acutorostrata TaxID=9767 RepID=A0ABM3SLE0_BALAC|nr:trafficking protein particle complex subunit 2-like protein isoform X1 [Balaenoptera acutorostrata]
MGWILVASAAVILFLQNYPLYIRSVPTENELKFHYMVHTSLDVVDEKISAMGKALVDQRELYLGLLYPTEDYKVYPRAWQRLRVWGLPAVAGRTLTLPSWELMQREGEVAQGLGRLPRGLNHAVQIRLRDQLQGEVCHGGGFLQHGAQRQRDSQHVPEAAQLLHRRDVQPLL